MRAGELLQQGAGRGNLAQPAVELHGAEGQSFQGQRGRCSQPGGDMRQGDAAVELAQHIAWAEDPGRGRLAALPGDPHLQAPSGDEEQSHSVQGFPGLETAGLEPVAQPEQLAVRQLWERRR